MKINILAVGTKMPGWVTDAWQEYAKRLQAYCKINLIEIPAVKRSNNYSVESVKKLEGELILNKLAEQSKDFIIALDLSGKILSTELLAKKINDITLNQSQSSISFIIGGPDGLSQACLNKVDYKLSLSNLTFPHPLVRVILIEQIYRSLTYLNNHPYHK